MKILYIVPFVPWEVRVRSFNLIPRLARHHDIHLVCVSSTEPSLDQAAWLRRYCQEVIHIKHNAFKATAQCAVALPTKTPLRMAYCRSKNARKAVRRLCEEVRPDLVYVERWRALELLPAQLDAPLVCDPTDSMTLYNRRLMDAGTWWERLLGWEECKKFSEFEGKLARRANVCVFCSRVDMDCVKQQAPMARFELVPNGVDCRHYSFKDESEEEPNTVIFTGSFKYRPNRRAVEFFLDNIFPLIRKEVQRARFLAIGNGASKALARYRTRDGFEAMDFVPTLRPYIARATVAVAPLTVGSGVTNKIGEGFAVGTPMVATPLACGDLPVRSGEHLLIGRDATEFAEHVITLLKDITMRRQLAVSARRLVEEKYDWEIVARKMGNVMYRAAGAGVDESSERKFETV
ncbi:MAG TPA: glycosyltransferase family 4 protein [Candidatus Acidoferrales bacterium]|nr:glycosyltransferase family 4 protein [Candidatus Acidoferrales bacterium]